MFNPSEHIMQIKGKDYLEVKWRMVWFREQCPQGTIDTEELAVDLDRETEEETDVWNPETRKKEKVMKRARGYARYRAIVTDGKGGRATATKSEKAASFPDFCEKAETGAVGRALAMLGYGTQFTGDELAEGDRLVDAPVDHGNVQQQAQKKPATYDDGTPLPTPLKREDSRPQKNGELRVGDVIYRGTQRGAWKDAKEFYATATAAVGKEVNANMAHQLTQKELATLNTLPPVTAAVY